MIKQLSILAFIFLFLQVKSQEKWSLERCIEYAFKNNVSIRQSEIAKKVNENNFLQSKMNFTPTLSADGSYNLNFGNSVNPTTYDFVQKTTNSNSFSVNGNLPLFTGLQQINNMKKSGLDLEASKQDLENAKNNMVLSIAQLYLQILQNMDLVQVAIDQKKMSEQQLQKTIALISAGAQPEGNRLQSDAQLATDDLKIVNAQNALDLSKLSLKLLLQLDPEVSFDVVIPVINQELIWDESVSAARIYGYAVTNQPSIKSAEYRLKSAGRSLAISKGAFSPTLSLYGSLRSNYFSESQTVKTLETYTLQPIGFVPSSLEPVYTILSDREITKTPYGTQLKNNFSQVVGVSLNLPIFSKWNRITNLSNAKLDLINNNLTLEAAKNKLKEDVYRAYFNAISAKKTYEANLKNTESLQKSYDFAKERFGVGSLAQIELNIIQNNLSFAQSELTRNKFDYLFKIKILDFYQGKTLSLN